VLPGTLDLVIRMHAARSLELVVRDPDQRDVEGVAVELGMNRAGSKAQLEEIAPGRYRMQLPDAPFSLEVSAPGFHTFTTERRALLDPATLSSPLEIVLHRAPIVRGRVVAAGRAVAGAHVELRRDMPEALETVNGFRCVMNSMADARGSTVADGAFELTCDLDGAVWVRASAPGLAPGELGPLDVAQLGADLVLELNEGGAIEGRVLLPEGRDGEGTIVAVNHGDGAPRTQRAGPDGSFRFEHLCVGRWQVLANAAEVDPTRRAYTSLPEAEPIEWNCEVSAGRSTRCDLDLRPK